MNKKMKFSDVLKQDNIEGLIDPNTFEPLVEPMNEKDGIEALRIARSVLNGDTESLNMTKEKLACFLYIFGYQVISFGMEDGGFCIISMAAEQGNAYASYLRGAMLATGRGGCERDREQAFECFLAAAKAGLVHGMAQVSIMYHFGIGADQNYAESDFWSEKAYKADKRVAENEIAGFYVKYIKSCWDGTVAK